MMPLPTRVLFAQIARLKTVCVPLALLAVALVAHAAARTTYAVADPYGRDLVAVVSDAPLCYGLAVTHALTGQISIDPTDILSEPSAEFTIDTATLNAGDPLRTEHLLGPGWLDAKKFPQLKLSLKSIKTNAKHLALTANVPQPVDAIAALTLRDQTVDIPLRLTVTLRPADDVTALRLPGDVLDIRARFDLQLSDFGIAIPDAARLLIADRQSVEVRLWASTQKVAPPTPAAK